MLTHASNTKQLFFPSFDDYELDFSYPFTRQTALPMAHSHLFDQEDNAFYAELMEILDTKQSQVQAQNQTLASNNFQWPLTKMESSVSLVDFGDLQQTQEKISVNCGSVLKQKRASSSMTLFDDEMGPASVLDEAKKKLKKAETCVSKPKTPKIEDFIEVEISKCRGKGEFSNAELATMLFFAGKRFKEDDPNPYSLIKRDMGTTRSRVSIRRKLEKIALQDMNIREGLLLRNETRRQCVGVIEKRLNNLLRKMLSSCNQEQITFAENIQYLRV